ncbi:hypothetical protein DFH08DRAFT_811782 [Mycena albidolilacea]|uniref:Uncharacterized protein n=1 Tax=Mycena albidolilacea TaxID=1033008 RepID=A0AAD6ZUL0_9AGAR|nr:hypothetical protein DFH08DRAFT_811782 [Mycena albidolilacea]
MVLVSWFPGFKPNQEHHYAEYRSERRTVRRLYAAKIPGQKSSVTVATYQGESAEELCSTASSGNIHATIFHDGAIYNFLNGDTEKFNIDLIPFQQFLELHRQSHLAAAYVYACTAVRNYFVSTFQHDVDDDECTFFVRRSTGRICVDLAPGNTSLYAYYYLDQRSDQSEFKSLNTPSLEAAALGFFTLEEYHGICYWEFSQCRDVWVYNLITTAISLTVWYLDLDYWLSQANHIFKHLKISSNFEDYGMNSTSSLSAIRVDLPRQFYWTMFSFASAYARLQKTHSNAFCFSAHPRIFKLANVCSSGQTAQHIGPLIQLDAERLSSEDAASLGFPTTQLSTLVVGCSWDASVYAGIRQFHQAKGFDPESQDVAQHLGRPLYELSSKINVPFAHIEDQKSCPASDGDAPTRVTTEEEFESGSEVSDTNHGK